jgi:hypothetical protein
VILDLASRVYCSDCTWILVLYRSSNLGLLRYFESYMTAIFDNPLQTVHQRSMNMDNQSKQDYELSERDAPFLNFNF